MKEKMVTIILPKSLLDRLEQLKTMEYNTYWRVILKLLNDAENKTSQQPETPRREAKKKTKSNEIVEVENSPVTEAWNVWVDAYYYRYGVDYPRSAKNLAMVKKIIESVGFENAKEILAFYPKALDPWIVTRQHPLELLAKYPESWVTRAKNNQLLISKAKIDKYDNEATWAEIAARVEKELEAQNE